MSYTFLAESGEESTAESLKEIHVYALLKSNLIAGKFCCNDNVTESCPASQFGMMSAHSTANLGEESLTSCAADSLALTFPPLGQITMLTDESQDLMAEALAFGSRCSESLARYGLSLSVLKTPRICELKDSAEFSKDLPAWGMMRDGVCLGVATLARITKETACGYPPLLPTPTSHNAKEGAYPAEFTRKTPTLSAQVGGKVNPDWNEQRMGLPIKASDLEPSEMHNLHSWLQLHGKF